MSEQMIRVEAVQFQHKASDKEYNFSRIEHFVNEAATQEVQIVSFPEACISGYWHVPELSREDLADLSESVPNGPSTMRLIKMSQESGITIGAGLFERSRGKFYNTFVVASPDGEVHKHRKLHAFEGPYMSSGKELVKFEDEWKKEANTGRIRNALISTAAAAFFFANSYHEHQIGDENQTILFGAVALLNIANIAVQLREIDIYRNNQKENIRQ